MEQKRTNEQQHQGGGLTRRQFLTYSAAAGLLAGLPSGRPASAAARAHSNRPTERRTVFFNFSYEADHETATYFVVIGERRLRLQSLKKKGADDLVTRERRRNAFLRHVPDDAFTHALPNVALPADAVQLCYVIKIEDPDPTPGEWA